MWVSFMLLKALTQQLLIALVFSGGFVYPIKFAYRVVALSYLFLQFCFQNSTTLFFIHLQMAAWIYVHKATVNLKVLTIYLMKHFISVASSKMKQVYEVLNTVNDFSLLVPSAVHFSLDFYLIITMSLVVELLTG